MVRATLSETEISSPVRSELRTGLLCFSECAELSRAEVLDDALSRVIPRTGMSESFFRGSLGEPGGVSPMALTLRCK